MPSLVEKIDSFTGDYHFLSNFYLAPVEYHGVVYPSTENAYQAHKTRDPKERLTFCSMTPGQAKRRGARIALREDWNVIKLRVMEELLELKFKSHPDLLEKLRATGDTYLEEGNHWGDTFWGVCDGKGQNFLGKLLMHTRTSL